MKKWYKQIEYLIVAINGIIYAACRQNYDELLRTFQDHFIAPYQRFLLELIDEGWEEKEQFIQASSLMLLAQEQEDYILLADYMELYLQPLFVSVLSRIRENYDLIETIDYRQANKDYFKDFYDNKLLEHGGAGPDLIENDYQMEMTEQGSLTMKIVRGTEAFYLHSNTNPWREAAFWAETYAADDAREYAVLGLGLGYHAIKLWRHGNGAINVNIYETDKYVMQLAERYQDFTVCYGDHFKIYYDPELKLLSEKLRTEGAKMAIHYPSLRNIRNQQLKGIFENFFIIDSTERNQKKYLCANFMSNISKNIIPVEHIRHEIEGKDVYIIAAGPSLDKNIGLLQKRKENSIIMATGTVFRKMISLNIIPDLCIMTDPNERTLNQIYENRDCQVPLLLLSTANYRLYEEYFGQKYIIFQKGFPEAERYAAEHDCLLFETGGSVSTAALDVCIRLKAGRIVFLGLDLAFTGNKAHASNTSNSIAAEEKFLKPVRAYNGGIVYSDYKFSIYADWLEKRLQQTDAEKILVINATEGGRFIKGMVYRTLRELLQEED